MRLDTDKRKAPTYYGHGDAATLKRLVEDGRWISVNLERRRMSVLYEYGRIAIVTGPRSPFATCAACGTFTKIDYIVGNEVRCSATCAPEARRR